jgi:ribose transport system ATP-binding protein
VDRLLSTVEQLRLRGTSVLYVSHRLDEVFRIADSVTVLRGGHVVASRPVTGLTTQSLAQLMVGSEVDAVYRAGLDQPADAPIALRARAIAGHFLRGVDIELREGEILGLAGLPGSGNSELGYALAGTGARVTGEVALADDPWMPIRKAASFDIPIVPAERAREAVVGEFGVRENLSLSVLDRFRRLGWLRRSAERALVGEWLQRTQIKAESPEAPISSLSGGNQQKVVIARCLARDPRILILCEPTAGVDVGTRQAIYEFIASRARAGLAVVVTSTDLGDLLAICTRVLVLVDGEISQELTGQHISEGALLHALEAETQ